MLKYISIPRCMSTQHPDNASAAFNGKKILRGIDEVHEALYAFSELGCDEQMWDCEGKEAYRSVVRTLLEEGQEFFKSDGNKLGDELRLTLRVPNPKYERVEKNLPLEILELIPTSYGPANRFYGDGHPPIHEAILPMTTSSEDLNRMYDYYKKHIGERDGIKVGGTTVGEWVGKTRPERINMIPLIEEKEYMLNCDEIVRGYLKGKDIDHQRVFLARSDPALNYGLPSAVLINKIALDKLDQLEKETETKIYPIIGVGSAPFRGNFRPDTVQKSLNEYPSVQTFTIQSAFKYDHPKEEVREAVENIKRMERGNAQKMDRERCENLIEKLSKNYREKIETMAEKINTISQYIPSRRTRKLHIGLFGYSRELDGSREKINLPRAIKFTASLYSLGFPPEVIGFSALDKEDLGFLEENYSKFYTDIETALQYINTESFDHLPSSLVEDAETALERYPAKIDADHRDITTEILTRYHSKNSEDVEELVVEAAKVRNFLG